MTTLKFNSSPQLTLIGSASIPFRATLPVGDGTTDYSAFRAFWNLGSPNDPEIPVLLGTHITGEIEPGDGEVVLSLSKEQLGSLPRRPMAFGAWLESDDGLTIVPIAAGIFVNQPGVGSGQADFPELGDDDVIDGGGP